MQTVLRPHNIDLAASVTGTDMPNKDVSDSTARSQDTQLKIQLSGTSLLTQNSPAAAQAPSSADSIVLSRSSHNRPWRQSELAISRPENSQDAASKDGVAALPQGAATAMAPRQLPLSNFLSPWTSHAQARDFVESDSKEASVSPMATAAVAADEGNAKPETEQLKDQDLLFSPPRTAVPPYAIISPSRQRAMGESGEPSVHDKVGVADSSASKASDTVSLGTGLSTPEPAKEMRPVFGRRAGSAAGPKFEAVPNAFSNLAEGATLAADRNLAAGPNLAAVSNLAVHPILAAVPKLAAGPNLAVVSNSVAAQRRDSLELLPDLDELLPDGDKGRAWSARPLSTSKTPLSIFGRPWGKPTSRGTDAEGPAVSVSAAGMEGASEYPGPQIAWVAPHLDMRPAAVGEAAVDPLKHGEQDSTAPAVLSQSSKEDRDLAEDSATGLELRKQESMQGNERSQSSSRSSELEGYLRESQAKCAELEAELAGREAAAQLQASETIQLAARCERVTRRLAEGKAAAQVARSESNSHEERCKELAAELVARSLAMEAVSEELEAARMRCEEVEGMLADRDNGMEQAWEELGLERDRCEELQQKLSKVRVITNTLVTTMGGWRTEI